MSKYEPSVDTGCEFSPSCFTCPLPKCKYELADEARRRLEFRRQRAKRKQEIQRLKDEGKTTDEIAEALGISKRTVWRRLAA